MRHRERSRGGTTAHYISFARHLIQKWIRIKRAGFALVGLTLLAAPHAIAATFTYSNTTPVAITDSTTNNVCTSSVTSTISVPDAVTIDDVRVGFVIDHTYKGDLEITLTSPDGTSVLIANRIGAGNVDYNVRVGDGYGSNVLANTHDAAISYPQFNSTSTNPMSAFDGESADGTWTLTVCDTFPVDTGTIDGFYLEIDDSSGGGGGSSDYSESFTSGALYSTGSTQVDNWISFRANAPSSGVDAITISGSNDLTGRSCTIPASAQAIANNLRTGTSATVNCDGHNWSTGTCGSSIELSVGTAIGVCACNTNYNLRPSVGSNWGGVVGNTCSAASQTITVSLTAPSSDPLIVTSTADTNTLGTLRYAINHANTNTSDDNITFNIPGSGPHVISPTSQLPAITDDGVSIDATSQPLTSCGSSINSTGGLTDRQLRIVLFGTNHSGDILRINGANDIVLKGLTIGNGASNGLYATNADRLVLECSHIGVSTDSTGNIGNGGNGAYINASDDVLIGDGTLTGANVFGFNASHGADIDGNSNAPIIKRNFFGTGIDGTLNTGNTLDGLTIDGSSNAIVGDALGGGNVFSGNGDDGLALSGGATATILGNFVGTNGAGTALVTSGDDGINATSTGLLNIGNGTNAGRNVIAGNDDIGIYLFTSSSAVIDNNLIGIGTGGESLGNRVGIVVNGTSSGQILNNVIANNINDGIEVESAASTAAIYANSIYANGDLGIDLGGDGVTINDIAPGDGDSGANNLLNFPVLNTVGANGTTSMTYDFNLDVPSDANGYRVDFFKTSTPDATNGEGEIYLGFVETGLHTGGSLNYEGSFTASATVDIGDSISSTATRMTGASSFDITSEFSLNYLAEDPITPATLVVAKTVTPLNASEYAVPGNDVIYTFNVKNEGEGSVDADSVEIIDLLPPQITFYNGDYDGAGPSMDRVGFDETSTTLTFDPAIDAKFSNSPTKPASFADCAYSPAAGYDANVTFICLNPKGTMAGGDPVPEFDLSFRVRIN